MGEGGAGLVIMEGGGVGVLPPRLQRELRWLVPPRDGALPMLPLLLPPRPAKHRRRSAAASL